MDKSCWSVNWLMISCYMSYTFMTSLGNTAQYYVIFFGISLMFLICRTIQTWNYFAPDVSSSMKLFNIYCSRCKVRGLQTCMMCASLLAQSFVYAIHEFHCQGGFLGERDPCSSEDYQKFAHSNLLHDSAYSELLC